MGLREAKIEDLIELFLLQHTATPQEISGISPQEIVWNRLNIIRDHFTEYTTGSKERLRELRSLARIPASNGHFLPGSELYFGHCQRLFEAKATERLKYVDGHYLALGEGETTLSWSAFLETLGVANAPRLILGDLNGKAIWTLSPEFSQLLDHGLIPFFFVFFSSDFSSLTD